FLDLVASSAEASPVSLPACRRHADSIPLLRLARVEWGIDVDETRELLRQEREHLSVVAQDDPLHRQQASRRRPGASILPLAGRLAYHTRSLYPGTSA